MNLPLTGLQWKFLTALNGSEVQLFESVDSFNSPIAESSFHHRRLRDSPSRLRWPGGSNCRDGPEVVRAPEFGARGVLG